MSYEVYKADFSNRHEIGFAVSIQLSRSYNGIGKMTIVLPIDQDNIEAIDVGGLVYDTESGESYTIQSVKKDSSANHIVVNGYTANWLLNKRVLTGVRHVENIEYDLYQIVWDNLRNLPRMDVGATVGLPGDTDLYLEPGQLLDTIMPVLDSAELGHRLTWNPDTMRHTFEIYAGEDLTSGIHAVVFSEEQGTAADLTVTDDNSTFKNFFYISGALQSGDSIVETLGDAEGGDRYEYYVKGGQTQDGAETEEEFRVRLLTECETEAARRLRRTSFTVNIDPTEFGTVYNLGDRVACVSRRFGVEFYARITGVTYKMDALGSSTSLVLGEPQLTALGEVKLG